MGKMKNTNPKDAIGSGKLPLHLWPETATIMGCMGLLDGMLKYGRGNYRAVGVRASIYVDACKRHLNAWFEGEDTDPDSGLPHLAHALACLAILVDAQAADQLTDDRQVAGGYRKLVEEMTTHVGRLKELHKDRDPKHYTIDDNEMSGEIKHAQIHGEPLPKEAIEDILDRGIRQATPQPIWQQPHYPLGGGVMSCTTTNAEEPSGDEEISELCREAQYGTVTLPLT